MNDVIYQDFFNEFSEYLLATTSFDGFRGYTRRPLTIDNSSLPFYYFSLGIEDSIDILDPQGTHSSENENLFEFTFNFGVHNPDKTKTDLQDLADAESDTIKAFRTEFYNYLKDTSLEYSNYFIGAKLRVERNEFVSGQKFYETISLYITTNYKHTMSTGA